MASGELGLPAADRVVADGHDEVAVEGFEPCGPGGFARDEEGREARELVAPPPALAAVGVLETDERDAPVPAVQERLRVQEAFVAEVEGRDCPIRASLQGFVEQDAGELLVLVE